MLCAQMELPTVHPSPGWGMLWGAGPEGVQQTPLCSADMHRAEQGAACAHLRHRARCRAFASFVPASGLHHPRRCGRKATLTLRSGMPYPFLSVI